MPYKKNILFITFLVFANAFAWGIVLSNPFNTDAEIYFLNVGQGDSELIKSGGASFLIDAGSNFKVLSNLEKLLPFYRKRIDVAFVSHGQLDHAGGMFQIIKNFDIGLVVYNGIETELWNNLKTVLLENKIPYVILSAGDKVYYEKNNFKIIWPSKNDANSKTPINDDSMVIKFDSENLSSLFTADISSKTEQKILNQSISADILKVPHHGSKYSSSENFIKAVNPKIAVVEVGKNSYGHPTQEVLKRISDLGAKIFRTDIDGIVKVFYQNNLIKVSGLK